jgi:hypothetical protein
MEVSLRSACQGLDLSSLQPITGPVKLFNHGFNGSLFTFSDAPQLDVFIHHNSLDYPGGFSVVS